MKFGIWANFRRQHYLQAIIDTIVSINKKAAQGTYFLNKITDVFLKKQIISEIHVPCTSIFGIVTFLKLREIMLSA